MPRKNFTLFFTESNFHLIISLLISLVVAIFVQRQVLTNPLAINDDVRNQIYWMARLIDPSLYPHDLIADYFTQSSLVSPALWLIYKLGSYLTDPIQISQFLPLLLAPLASYFAYRFGENFAGKRYGFLSAFSFNMLVWLSRNLAGGLARSFAYPLLFAFLWCYSKNIRSGLIITAWLASLIYPPILFLSAGIWLLGFLPPSFLNASTEQPENNKPDFITFLWGIGGGLAILIYRFVLAPIHPVFGQLTNSRIAAQTPEFYEGGRVPIFHFFHHPLTLTWPDSLLGELFARTPGASRLLPLAGILLAAWGYKKLISPKLGKLKIPSLVWQLLIASILLYILAWLMLFYLYVPERYLQFSMPVLYTFLLAGILNVLLDLIENSKLTARLKTGLLIAPFLFCILIFSKVWDQNLMLPQPDMLPVFEYLKQTPKNTMIATTPGLASDIPFYAKRSVILSQEGYIPFHQAYFQIMKKRLKDFLIAYYSKDPETVIRFIQQYKIDYIMVNRQDYLPERLRLLHKKYYHSFPKSFYRQLLQNDNGSQTFILSHPQPSCQVVHSGHYILLPTKAILTGNCLIPLKSTKASP